MITGGTGGNTFNVNNTSDFYDYTFLAAGAGPNHVNIKGTTGELIVQSDLGGQNVVTVRQPAPALGGSLGNIRGPIAIWDQTNTTLVLDDSGDLNRTPKRSPSGSMAVSTLCPDWLRPRFLMRAQPTRLWMAAP